MTPEQKIKNVLISNLKHPEKYKIFLFWSRAKGEYKTNSDYDIWIIGEKKIDFLEMLRLKRKLNELPYLIDLVDFKDVSKDFSDLALKYKKEWK